MSVTNKATTCLSTVMLLAGCATTLDVQSDPGSSFSEGIPQVLPFTRYEVTATWRLISCDQDGAKVALAVTAVAGAEDDPAQRYLIDARSLQGPLTRSDLAVSYHDGSSTLKSVNAEVEDRTAAFIGNVVTSVVNLAPLLAGAPTPGSFLSHRTPRTTPPRCSDAIRPALQRVAALEGELETMTAALGRATDDVATLAARIARMGSSVDTETSAQYGRALRRLEELTTTHAGLTDRLAAALEPVTYRRTVRWPSSGSEFELRTPLEIPPATIERWVGNVQYAGWPKAFLLIEPAVEGGREPRSDEAPRAGTRVAGIPYRVTVRGRLVTCPSLCSASDYRRTVAEGPIAQLGGVNVLPVRNPPLGSTAFAAEFNRDGTLVSAGYEQRTAPLEEAAAIAADATERLAPLLDPTQRLERETAYLEALRARRDAAAALEPAPTNATDEARAALEAETTLLNAEIANRQARLTLQELQARPPAG